MNDREETALVRREMKESLSVLRIYLRRRTTVKKRGVLGWLKSKSLSMHLVEEALKVGITYGSVTMGHLGFVHGEKHVAEDGPDAPPQRLPTCVELVADRAVLDAFVDAFGHELLDAVLVRFDGAAVSLIGGTDMTWRTQLGALVQWIGLGALVGVFSGAASALFLFLLAEVTDYRVGHEVIVYFLPVAGLAIGVLYARFGEPIKAGNNLVIDTIHDEGPEIPIRMAPMVLIGTVLTHLFGGSAGREGTAVQMGASLADYLSHRAKLSRELRVQLLAAGVAGGFGSVFGTPIAGAIFGLEFVVLGRIEYRALVPALVASIVGDMTTRGLGIVHTAYPTAPHVAISPLLCLKWLVFAVAIAVMSIVFIELTHFLRRQGERHVKMLGLRMAIGGAIVVGLWQLVGTSDYLGLGVPMIVRSFNDPQMPEWAFALKLLFTAITLGAGFLGGEVTPLFFIGATLGSVLAPALGIPRELGAGVGLAAVFASASNTPLALSIMAVELLGANALPHVVIVCVFAYLITGHRSIYPSQRVTHGKGGGGPGSPTRLRELTSSKPPPPHEDGNGPAREAS